MMRLSRRKKPVVWRGTTDFDSFYSTYKTHYENHECAIHFRWATHGSICMENCHPYMVTEGVWMMHNGVFSDIGIHNTDMSDTWHFARLLEPLAEKGWLREPIIEHMLENAMAGTGNRLLVMDSQGIKIYNSKSGGMLDGIWYSNMSMWDAPKKENGFFKPKNVGTPSKDDKEYIGWWLNALNTGTQDIENAPPDIADMWRHEESQSNALALPLNAGVNEKETVIEFDPMDEIPNTPNNLVEFAALSRGELRLVTYNEPDAVADSFFDFLQNGLVIG